MHGLEGHCLLESRKLTLLINPKFVSEHADGGNRHNESVDLSFLVSTDETGDGSLMVFCMVLP